jgi:hypothetical protein
MEWLSDRHLQSDRRSSVTGVWILSPKNLRIRNYVPLNQNQVCSHLTNSITEVWEQANTGWQQWQNSHIKKKNKSLMLWPDITAPLSIKWLSPERLKKNSLLLFLKFVTQKKNSFLSKCSCNKTGNVNRVKNFWRVSSALSLDFRLEIIFKGEKIKDSLIYYVYYNLKLTIIDILYGI